MYETALQKQMWIIRVLLTTVASYLQGGSTRRRSRLSYGRGGGRGDASLPPVPQPSSSPPAVRAAAVVLPGGDDIIVHEAVEQPLLFGELPASGELAVPVAETPEAGAAATDATAAELAASQTAAGVRAGNAAAAKQPAAAVTAALLPSEVAEARAEPVTAAVMAVPAQAAVSLKESGPKTTQPPVAVSEGSEAGLGGVEVQGAAPPAAATAAGTVSTKPAAEQAKAAVQENPDAPMPATGGQPCAAALPTSPAPAPVQAAEANSLAPAPAAAAAVPHAAAAASAYELERLEVASSDGSYCSAASQSGSLHG